MTRSDRHEKVVEASKTQHLTRRDYWLGVFATVGKWLSITLIAGAFLVAELALIIRIAQLDDRLTKARIQGRQQSAVIHDLGEQVDDLTAQLRDATMQIHRLEAQVEKLEGKSANVNQR